MPSPYCIHAPPSCSHARGPSSGVGSIESFRFLSTLPGRQGGLGLNAGCNAVGDVNLFLFGIGDVDMLLQVDPSMDTEI